MRRRLVDLALTAACFVADRLFPSAPDDYKEAERRAEVRGGGAELLPRPNRGIALAERHIAQAKAAAGIRPAGDGYAGLSPDFGRWLLELAVPGDGYDPAGLPVLMQQLGSS